MIGTNYCHHLGDETEFGNLPKVNMDKWRWIGI